MLSLLQMYMFNHVGHKAALTTFKKGDVSIPRCEKQLIVVYDEESIMERLGPMQENSSCFKHLLVTMPFILKQTKTFFGRRDRKQNFAVKQSETVHVLMPPNGLKVLKKKRPAFMFCHLPLNLESTIIINQ